MKILRTAGPCPARTFFNTGGPRLCARAGLRGFLAGSPADRRWPGDCKIDRMPSRGFSVIEVLIAVALLSVGVLGSVQLVAMSMQAMAAARSQNLTVVLASARLEDLRGLTFEFDDLGIASTDLQTDLSVTPRSPGGGGLTAGGSITSSVNGYVDHLDGRGGWVAGGPAVPPAAAYTRRWSIAPSVVAPDTLVLEVLVFPVAGRPTGTAGRGIPGAAHMVTLVSRRQR